MNDDVPPELSRATSRYPMLSGLSLLSIPAACLIYYLIVGDYTWLNAISLLIVPFAVFLLVFHDDKIDPHGRSTILVHSIDLRYPDRRRHIIRYVHDYAALRPGVCETRDTM